MAEDRGEYRSIYAALFDDPDFQALPAESRWVLVTLRLTLGPCAIAVVPALAAVLAERTGLGLAPDLLNPEPRSSVPAALEDLRQAEWIETESNVVWVVNGLRFEPHLNPRNSKHRAYVQRIHASLPRLAICDRFRARYSAWFDGLPMTAPSVIGDNANGNGKGHEEASDGSRSRAPATATTHQQPSDSTSQQPDGVREGSDWFPDAEAYTRALTVAINGVLDQKLAGGYKSIVALAEIETGRRIFQAGVPLDLARATAIEVAQRFQPSGRSKQPHSLSYFEKAIMEAFERSRATPAPDDVALRVVNLVCAYHGRELGLEDQLLTTGREAMIAARYRESHDVSELLFGVDGIARDTWAKEHGKVQLEDLFRTRGELERHARAAGYKPGRVHPSAGADVAGAT